MVELALTALGPVLASKSIALFSDSSTTVAVLKRLYTKSVHLRELLHRIGFFSVIVCTFNPFTSRGNLIY